MASDIQYQNDFIVGGKNNARVTPNFTLGELTAEDGKVFVHRELAAGLQELRDGYGHPVRIAGLMAKGRLGTGLDGQIAWLTGDDPDAMEEVATKLIKEQFFIEVLRKGNELYVQIPDPSNRLLRFCGINIPPSW